MAKTQVLEITLNDDQYCLDIDYVSEIIRRTLDDIQIMPNAPLHMEGVLNLRDETTKIIDVGKILSLEERNPTSRDKVIVFNEAERTDGKIGWAVDEVTRVSTIDTEDVEQTDEETLKGIINREEGFLLWTDPESIPTTT